MAPTTVRMSLALAVGIALGATAASCSSKSSGCASSADCPSGYSCLTDGACLPNKGETAAASSGHSATSASGGPGASSGSSGASSGAAGGSVGSTSVAASSGAGNGGSVGTSGTGSGGSCSCSASCCSQVGTAGITCPNGKACYGTVPDSGADFYCNYQSGKCDPFDPCDGGSGVWTCNGSGGSNGTSGSAPTVDPTGFSFAIVGDTRPNEAGDPYPTATINAIYTDIANLPQTPTMVIATGDFQEDGSSLTATSEIDDYESAAALFKGPTYPVMGNHECVGASITTYCQAGVTTGNPNFSAYLQMLSDLKIPDAGGLPYYWEFLTAPNGDTAKFISYAANAYTTDETTWLNSVLEIPSTFTFLGRHEPDDSVGCTDSTANNNATSSCPFIADVQTAINNHPGSVTMKLEGHTHEMRFDNTNDAIVSGSGGVAIENPCTASDTIYCNFGYVLCQELTNKTFLCTMYDMNSGALASPPPRLVTAAGVMSYSN